MQVEGESIEAIAKRVQHRRFRVRNILTLQDFVIVDPVEVWAYAVNLDNRQWSQLNGELKRYALLSTTDEVECLSRVKSEPAIKLAAANYGQT